MLVLALDTSTDAVVVGLLELPASGEPRVLAGWSHPGDRLHGEQLMPAVLAAGVSAGRGLAEVDAVVCGVGPGPFTGLRVGLVSAAGLGDALAVPVYGVCSLDAIAHRAGAGGPLLVVSDARRREVYWAAYDGRGRRIDGPAVASAATLAERVPGLGVCRVAGPVAAGHAALFGLPECGTRLAPDPAGLVAAALPALRAGAEPAALEPCYLRRPDAVPPSGRKLATAPAERARVTTR